MNLLETLVLASYFYTTAVWVWLERRLEKLRGNEIAHLRNQLQDEINELRELQGLPPRILPRETES